MPPPARRPSRLQRKLNRVREIIRISANVCRSSVLHAMSRQHLNRMSSLFRCSTGRGDQDILGVLSLCVADRGQARKENESEWHSPIATEQATSVRPPGSWIDRNSSHSLRL